ncbi:MAG: diguanylate cyclase [Anaerolineales bacterium]|nr:diguanylate cyclase [Anaerolineales bacterium]
MNVDDEDVCVNQPMKEMHKGDSQGEIGACENTGEGGKTESKTQQMEPYQGRNIEAEGALSESDHRLQALFEQSNDAVFFTDLNLRLLDVNKSASQLFGYEVDELIGVHVQQLIAPEEWGEAMEKLPLILSGESLPVYQRTFVRKDGTKVLAEVSVTHVCDPNGKPLYIQSIARDITERIQAEKVIKEERALLRTLIDNIPAFIYAKDEKCRFILNNRAHIQSMGARNQKDVQGKTDLDVFPEELAKQYLAADQAVVTLGFPILDKEELYFNRNTGEAIWISATKAPIKDEQGKVIGLVGVSTDITERKIAAKRLQHLATHDPLTGLPNRVLLFDRLNHAMALAKRNETYVALLFIDLDGFKNINDEHGHEKGDFVLQELANRLQERARESDTIGRLSGDEFIYILENISGDVHPSKVAERLLSSIRKPFNLNGDEVYLTASIGVSIFPEDGDDPHDLLRNADIAMYRKKESGKDGYLLYS